MIRDTDMPLVTFSCPQGQPLIRSCRLRSSGTHLRSTINVAVRVLLLLLEQDLDAKVVDVLDVDVDVDS